MKTFYKLEAGKAQVGQGTIVPDGFIEYSVGQEPLELTEALEKEAGEQELQSKINEAQQYLNNTDWYFARKAETGEEVPEDVVFKRAESRKFIQDNKGVN